MWLLRPSEQSLSSGGNPGIVADLALKVLLTLLVSNHDSSGGIVADLALSVLLLTLLGAAWKVTIEILKVSNRGCSGGRAAVLSLNVLLTLLGPAYICEVVSRVRREIIEKQFLLSHVGMI
ncbi:hypothetical protein POM88_034714 [Heracleum sosnowskyi]|uniref:Uncharacterized protein n=1 Tax=Heracleum sosnowskyi TaxID=360622 RepID=A0AAD8HLY1_9APIA|nr:hypothetical protein POM88_034714 [Heracleum sosnowskyi]